MGRNQRENSEKKTTERRIYAAERRIIMTIKETPVCEICGAECLVTSIVTLDARYESIHDGSRLTIEVCGDCFDKLYREISSTLSNTI